MNAPWLIAPGLPQQRFAWHCPTCDQTGWSSSRHGAVQNLHRHWRRCTEPNNAAPLETFT